MMWKTHLFRALCLGLFAYAAGAAAAALAPDARDALGATRFPLFLAASLILAAVAMFRFLRPGLWHMAAAMIMVMAMAACLWTSAIRGAGGDSGPHLARMAIFAVVYAGLRITQPREDAEEAA